MKKLLLIFAVTSFWSCSNDEHVQASQATTQNSLSVLDGKLLSFKDDESFVKEYSGLSELNTDQLKSWDSAKKFTALLSVADDSSEIEGDVVPKSRLVYSDALKALLNSESKVKIGGKILWLNGRNFYLLGENDLNKTSEELVNEKDGFSVYGELLSLSGSKKSLTSRNVLPNENQSKTFETDEMNVLGSRLRHVVDLFNETIVLNDDIKTSKMYLRSTLQYRSCSAWKCSWREATELRRLSSNFCQSCNGGAWDVPLNIPSYGEVTGTQTYLISNWKFLGTPSAPSNWYPNFVISGPITCQISGSNPVAVFSTNLSWY